VLVLGLLALIRLLALRAKDLPGDLTLIVVLGVLILLLGLLVLSLMALLILTRPILLMLGLMA
jgi:hypothetical protein